MFKRSENDLKQLVRIAWELGRVAGNRISGDESEVMLDTLATHLQASGWSLRRGMWSGHPARPKITWKQQQCTPGFPASCLASSKSFAWNELLDSALELDTTASRVVSFENHGDESSEDRWCVLQCDTICPDGAVKSAAFVKPIFDATLCKQTPFTELERVLVDAMIAHVDGSTVPVPIGENEMVAKTGLPKRQREVLELLLRGESLKQIASELRISPHTVNDYSKALYRHFDVSGRAELAAMFRNPEQLELSNVE